MIHLQELVVEKAAEGPKESEDALAKVLRAAWGMLYADDAGITFSCS